MENKRTATIGWIDLLRIIAITLMVLAHACDGFVSQFDTNKEAFLSGVFTGSFVRSCVPLFAMITGVLLLPTRESMTRFYKKRIGRIIVPLIAWSILLPLLFFVYLNFINPNTVNPSIDMAGHSLKAELIKMGTFVFNFNYDTTPLWYLYMLIGLYLIMPIISAWLRQATQKEVRILLGIWAVTLVLPYWQMVAPFLGYTGNFGSMGILGECFWNKYGTFYYFSGFLGYIVLGYYLVKYPLNWSMKKTLSVSIPLFLVGYAITAVGFQLMQIYFPGNYEYLEIVWYFTGINVAMMTVAVFITIQKINIPASSALSTISSNMFGVYLVHFVFIQAMYDLFIGFNWPSMAKIALITITTFAISYLITALMKLTKPTARLVS